MTTKQIELAYIIKENTDTEYIKTILDSPKYYSVLSMGIDADLCGIVYNNLTTECFRYLVLSRKIAWQNDVILIKLMQLLRSSVDIERFFSFYDHQEMIEMMQYDMGNFNPYVYRGKSIYFTYIIYCMATLYTHQFSQYLIKYCADYNISMLRLAKHGKGCLNIMHNKSLLCAIDEHETAVKYRRSLRNAWIIACITI